MDRTLIKKYIDNQPQKIVTKMDLDKNKIEYQGIRQGQIVNEIKGDEEMSRSFILTRLVNELGYSPDRIEIEHEYTAGRPHTNTSRIDIVVRDAEGNAFLFIECKSPDAYASDDRDQIIEEQLYKVAGMERTEGNSVRYLVLYTTAETIDKVLDECIIIDTEKFPTFADWEVSRDFSNTLPARYGKAQKTPYIKASAKDLETDFSNEMLNQLQTDLHNVLWGGGGTDDNEVFASLTNLILAKIQDEDEKEDGDTYDFQSMTFAKDGDEEFETNEQLFERINALYRRALKSKLYILDENELQKSYVIDSKKFSLSIAVGRHEGFIPSEQWIEVQELLDAIAEKYNRPHRKTNALLAGLAHCPHCGRRLSVISESDRWTNGKPRFKYVCPGYRKKECNFKAVDGVLLDEFVVQQLSELSDENSERFRSILEIKIEEVLEQSQTVQEHNLIKKKRDKLKADIAAQTRNLREADGSIKQFIQEDLQNLAEELRETERQISKLDEGRKNNMIAIRDLEMTKERLLSFAEYAKDAQPEVLVTLIQTIVERIYIVDKDDKRYCHIFIKGCSGEDYTGFFQTAGYIEQKTTCVCDSEQYCICAEVSAQSVLRRKTQGDWENTAAVMRMEKGEYRRGGSMSGSYSHAP